MRKTSKHVSWSVDVEGGEAGDPSELQIDTVDDEERFDIDKHILDLVNAEEEANADKAEAEAEALLLACHRLLDPKLRTRVPSWLNEASSLNNMERLQKQWKFHATKQLFSSWLVRIIDYNSCSHCKSSLSVVHLRQIRKLKDPNLLTKYIVNIARLCIILNDYSERIRRCGRNSYDELVITGGSEGLTLGFLILQTFRYARELALLVDGVCSSSCAVATSEEFRRKFLHFDT